MKTQQNKIKTMKDWKGDFNESFLAGDQIDEEVYYHMLNCMPPIYRAGYFCMSEPLSHDENGRPQYLAFQRINNKYFYLGIR